MRNPEEEQRCANCDATGVTLHDAQGEMLCEECSFKCHDCGEWFHTNVAEESEDGDICEDCRANDYIECARCDHVVRSDETTTVGDDEWCQRCTDRYAVRCERCDTYFPDEENQVRELQDTGRHVCDSCYDRLDAFYCSACGYDYSGRVYGGQGRGGESRCEDCYEGSDDDEEEEEEPPPPPVEEAIQGYHSHKRRWNRFGKSKTGIYYGVEIEAISQKDLWDFPQVAEKLEATFGKLEIAGERPEFLFTEFDGSLRENPDDSSSRQRGFETVIHPMSPEFIKENVPLFKNILDLMVEGKMVSFRSVDQGISAGMHVTFTWEPLDKWSKLKFLYLIYGNRQLTTTVSRRMPASLARYAKIEAPAKPPAMVLRKEGYEAKYVAVNLKNYLDKKTGNYIDLAEVRFFRGTLKLRSFFMNLEYVFACVDFARDQRFGLSDTKAEKLLAYINAHKKLYPNIHAWLKEKGLIK